MIPDKIYLGIGPMSGDEPNKRYLYAEWDEEQRPLIQNIAYIRKDALLEWAKAVKADPMIPMNIDKVIEKIESL